MTTATLAPNAIGASVGLLGDEWSLLIVQQALQGVTRFGHLQTALGIGPTVLTTRLASLTEAGVLEKGVEGYALTASGKDLWSLLLCIWAWEQRWVQGAALPTMRHQECGQVFTPELACTTCANPVVAADVELAQGPSGDFARTAPAGTNRRRAGTSRPDGPGLFPETMVLMGSRWSSALLGACFLGAHRFTDFTSMLGAPPNVVSERLKAFVAVGVLDTSYDLTAKGADVFPTVCQLVAWGERWHPAPDGPALVARHDQHPFVPGLRCSHCSIRLHRRAVTIERTSRTA
ncbi:MAG: HxlR family transcriptional regulator [Frankiales bacterium]|nr:HxlR family transcriptional regulator [Frankiales bacterium]